MSISPLGPSPRVPASAPPGIPRPASLYDPVQRTKSAASRALPPSSVDIKKGAMQGRNLWIENGGQIASQLKSGKVFRLSIGSRAVTIRLLKPMGSGRYHDAFLVEVDGNEPMILKLPNRRMQNMPNQRIAEILKNELLLYKKFKAILDYETNAGRVAMFHDLERLDVSDHEITGEWANAHLTHGFHLVEYIPNEFPLSKKDGEIPMKGDGFLAIHPSDDALSAMFRAASVARMEDPAGKTLCVNLQRDNIRMDNDGILVLIDPQPPSSDKDFETLVEKFLATFSPPGSDRYRFLDPRD